MNLTTYFKLFQSLLISALLQSAFIMLAWNILGPSLFKETVVTITYGQAFLMYLLYKCFTYDSFKTYMYHNIAYLALLADHEAKRRDDLDKMIFHHQERLEEVVDKSVQKEVE